MTRPRATWLTLIVALLLSGARPLAHDEAPKPLVELRLVPAGSQLTVSARLPIVALMDANLPLNDQRRLDIPALDQPMQLVARDLAQQLDLSQGGTPLPLPLTTVRLAPDTTAIEVGLTYVVQPTEAPITARLRAYRSLPEAVATRAVFVTPEGERAFVVAGAPELVTFNPTRMHTIRMFARRGLEAVLATRTAWLLALLLAVMGGAQATRGRALTAWMSALVVGAGAALLLPSPVWTGDLALGVGASVVVIAALAALVDASPRWLPALAAAFGLTHGIVTGLAVLAARAYGGAHGAAAVVAFTATVALATVWLVVLLSVVAARGVAGLRVGRALTMALCVYVTHAALHQVTDSAARVANVSTWNPDYLMAGLVTIWLAVLIVSRPGQAAPRLSLP